MDILQYIRDVIPAACGVHPANGNVAALVLQEEKDNPEAFKAELFDNPRDRARLMMPYAPAKGYELEYERKLDVLELLVVRNGNQKYPGDDRYNGYDTEQQEAYLEASMSDEQLKEANSISTREWWSG
jgi:hypothetical protein